MTDKKKEEWLEYIKSIQLRKTLRQERHKEEIKEIDNLLRLAINEATDEGVTVNSIAKNLDVTRQTIYRLLNDDM